MDFTQRNNFVVTHASDKYFEKDVELYKRLFPKSPIIRELENAPQFRKKELDARILNEILTEGRICDECILEHRGIITLKQKEAETVKNTATLEDAKKELLALDVNQKIEFEHLVNLCKKAGLHSKGNKKVDYLALVKAFQKANSVAIEVDANIQANKEEPTQEPAVNEPDTTHVEEDSTAEANKKKEGQE